MRYIKGTLDYGITYYLANHPASSLEPILYSDASYADCIESARSTQGHVMILASGPVSWSTKRQDVVALSTTKAKYIALVHAGQMASWISKLLHDIKLPTSNPIQIYTD